MASEDAFSTASGGQLAGTKSLQSSIDALTQSNNQLKSAFQQSSSAATGGLVTTPAQAQEAQGQTFTSGSFPRSNGGYLSPEYIANNRSITQGGYQPGAGYAGYPSAPPSPMSTPGTFPATNGGYAPGSYTYQGGTSGPPQQFGSSVAVPTPSQVTPFGGQNGGGSTSSEIATFGGNNGGVVATTTGGGASGGASGGYNYANPGGSSGGMLSQFGGAVGGAAGAALSGLSSQGASDLSPQVSLNAAYQQAMLGTAPGTPGSYNTIYTQMAGWGNKSPNAVATSAADAAQGFLTLGNLTGTPGNLNATALGKAAQSAWAGAGVLSPGLGSTGAAQLASAVYNPVTSYNMRRMGYGVTPMPARNSGGSPASMAQIAQGMFTKWFGNAVPNSQQLASSLAPGQTGSINLNAMGLNAQSMTPVLEGYDKLFQQGVSAKQANTLFQQAANGSSLGQINAAQNKLESYGIPKTDFQSIKDLQSQQTGRQSETSQGFTQGLNDAVTALEAFNSALNNLLNGPLGTAYGTAKGAAAGAGLPGSPLSNPLIGGLGGGLLGSLLGKGLGGLAGGLGKSIFSKIFGAGAKGASGAGAAAGNAGGAAAGTAAGDAAEGAAANVVQGTVISSSYEGAGAAAGAAADVAGGTAALGGLASLAGPAALIGGLAYLGATNNPTTNVSNLKNLVQAALVNPTTANVSKAVSALNSAGYHSQATWLQSYVKSHGVTDAKTAASLATTVSTNGVPGARTSSPVMNAKNGPGMATGGRVQGGSSRPGADDVHAMLSKDEAVLNAGAAKALGYSRIDQLNQQYANGLKTEMKDGMLHAAGGAALLGDARKYAGHRYVYGGPSNPQQGWDCSSFASYVIGHDEGMQLPGGSWASTTSSGQNHGPTADQFLRLPGAHSAGHNPANIQPGDVLVWPTHVGFGVGPGQMFSAYDTAEGTLQTPKDLRNASGPSGETLTIMRYGSGKNVSSSNSASSSSGSGSGSSASPALSPALGGGGGGLGLSPGTYGSSDDEANIESALLGGIGGGGGGWAGNLATSTSASNGGTSNSANGGTGGKTPSGSGGSGIAALAKYLLKAGYSKAAAAGAAGVAGGEGTGANPEIKGSGGYGLIGWTPPGGISSGTPGKIPPGFSPGAVAAGAVPPWPTGNQSKHMAAQEVAMVNWMKLYGWPPPQKSFANSAAGALQAAYSASATYEKPAAGGSDVHSQLVNQAWSAVANMATGGNILVGERGPELISMKNGTSATVMSAAQTQSLIKGNTAQPAQAPWMTSGSTGYSYANAPQNAYQNGGNSGGAGVNVSLNISSGAIVIQGGGAANSSTDISNAVTQAFSQSINVLKDNETLRNVANGVKS